MSNIYFLDSFGSSGFPSSWPELFPELLEFKTEEGHTGHNSSPLLSDDKNDLALSALSSPTRASDQSLCSPSHNVLGADLDPFDAAHAPSPISGYASWLQATSGCTSSPDTDFFFDFDTEPITSEPEPESTMLNSSSDEEPCIFTADLLATASANAPTKPSKLSSVVCDGFEPYDAIVAPSSSTSMPNHPSWPESLELDTNKSSQMPHSHLTGSSSPSLMASSAAHKEQHRATRVCGGCGLEKKRVYRYLGASAPFCNACNQHWRRHLHECPLCLKLRSLNATEQLRGVDITNYDGPTKTRRKDSIAYPNGHSLMHPHSQGIHAMPLSLPQHHTQLHSAAVGHANSHSFSLVHANARPIGHHTVGHVHPIPNPSSFPISPLSGPIRKRHMHTQLSSTTHKPYAAVAPMAFRA